MQIMIALRFYATGTFQRVTGDSFGVSFLADVKENLGGFPVTVKYRRPYAVTVVTDSILCIVAAIWRGCRKFESCT